MSDREGLNKSLPFYSLNLVSIVAVSNVTADILRISLIAVLEKHS